ncbi:helix-turn-helix transcriptional regulator [Streptomyces sp. NPDC001205]
MSRPPGRLTAHQLDLLRRFAAGETIQQIAVRDRVAASNVGKTAARLRARLGAKSLPHAVDIGHRLGLLGGDQ